MSGPDRFPHFPKEPFSFNVTRVVSKSLAQPVHYHRLSLKSGRQPA